jgi:uncharacterized protein YjbI with pentapeptide repeats
VVIVTAAITFSLSLGTIEGIQQTNWGITFNPMENPRETMPRILALFRYDPFANFRQSDVSIKPANWTGQTDKEKEELALVKGAQLWGSDLRYLQSQSAFLAKAELSKAMLQSARLHRANLQEAYLISAELQGADLSSSNLRGANLFMAKLQGANLVGADLQRAKLLSAKLQKAQLTGAQLQGANLALAELQGANLVNAKLQEVRLGSAKLEGANLEHADLRGANLERVDLSKVQNLKQQQLDEACGDNQTTLPPGLKRPPPCPAREQEQ